MSGKLIVAAAVLCACSDGGGKGSPGGMGGASGGGGASSGSGGSGGSSGSSGTGGRGGAAGGGGSGGGAAGGMVGAPADAMTGTGGTGGASDGPPPGLQRLTWRKQVGPGFARAVGGTSATDVWIVGDNRQVWNSKGDGNWQMRDPGTDVRLEGVWGTGPDNVYVAPNINYILRWKGSWVKETTGIPLAVTFHEFWGTGPNDVYVAGGGLMHSTGDGTWTSIAIPNETNGIGSISGSGNEIWGLGLSGVAIVSRGDGKWTPETPGLTSTAKDIWVAGPGNVYVLGAGEVVHRNRAGTWAREPLDRGDAGGLLCIWGSGPTDLFIGAAGGGVFRSQGDGRWFRETIDAFPPNNSVYSIWGTSPGNVYLLTGVGVFHGTPQ